MSKDTQLVNKLYEKYVDLTKGNLHDVLWQLVVNREEMPENNVGPGISAFVYISVPRTGGHNVGIVSRNLSGYIPTNFSFNATVSKQDRKACLDEMNKAVFDVSPEVAEFIETSSYIKPEPQKRWVEIEIVETRRMVFRSEVTSEKSVSAIESELEDGGVFWHRFEKHAQSTVETNVKELPEGEASWLVVQEYNYYHGDFETTVEATHL